MSYSRVAHPQTSRTQRGRGRGSGHTAANSYQPRPVNSTRATAGGPSTSDSGHRLEHGHYGAPLEQQDNYAAASSTTASTAETRSLQRHGPYHVLPPNPQKNAKLKKTALEEAAQFERHKAEKKLKTVETLSYQPPAAVGGHSYSKEALDKKRQEQERKQQMEARFAKVRQRAKREEYRQQQREREEEEIQQRKMSQREKAKRLEAKQEQRREEQLEEMRRKRLERFDSGRS